MRRLFLLVLCAQCAIAAQFDSHRSTGATVLFDWHAEDTNVTVGTPAGFSKGDTTGTVNSGASLSTTQVYDGTYSMKCSAANNYYAFDWAAGSTAIVNPYAGTFDFMFYPDTLTGNQSIFEMRVDANNRIMVSIDAANKYILLTHVAGATSSTARTGVNAFAAGGGWYRVKCRWDTSAHNGLYLNVTCDLTNGEGNSAQNGTTALGTWSGTSGTFKVGDMNGVNGVYYVDKIKIYNRWTDDVEVYYVDPSASSSTENGTTAQPYKSLNAALAGKVNRKLTAPVQIRCRTSGGVSDTTRVTDGALGQFSTTATAYLHIVAETGHRASASWDTNKYNLYVDRATSAQSGTAMALSKGYIYIDGLQIGISAQAATAEICYISQASTGWMANCLVRGQNSSSQVTRGISSINGINLINCIFYAIGNNVGSAVVKNHGNSTFYNVTGIGGGSIGLDVTDGTCIAKNCYFGGATSDYLVSTGSLTMTTCASADASTGSAGLRSIPVSTATFVNVTAGSENYHLVTGSSLKNSGTNTSGDAYPFNSTFDIDGVSRVSPWDIGATEF